MVFFVCGSCGESLKKSNVEKHSYRCRGCQFMTCMDCSKDFWGNEYEKHTSCITEDQKYGGSNYVGKAMTGQNKQQLWVTQVRESLSTGNMSHSLRQLFDRVLTFDSLPRKRAKFINLLRSLNFKNESLIEDAWAHIEKVTKVNTPQQTSNNPSKKEESGATNGEVLQAENGEVNGEVKPPKKSKREKKEERRNKQTKVQKIEKRKRAHDNEDGDEETEKPKKKKKNRDEDANQENQEPGTAQEEEENENQESEECTIKRSPFKWKKAISTVLQDAPEEGMKMKKFKRKVFALYLESKADNSHIKSDHEIEALISKKLQMRNDKYLVVKDRVKLRSSS